ncbi:MAG: DUF3892 domain-containing protein [Gammaproteobacteria bacterium]|nr:MAG: DUF3892 domain-containing protein [Gammaproteobacteria bacterium]
MQKQVDFYISQVRYNDNHTKMVRFYVHPNNNNKAGKGFFETLEQIIEKIDDDFLYYTINKTPNNRKWQLGSKVMVYQNMRGVEYLKTEGNKTDKDNLENLQEF